LDGNSYQGEVRLDFTGQIIIVQSNEIPVAVDLTNLVSATFTAGTNTPPQAGSPASTGLALPKGELPSPWNGLNIGETTDPGSSSYEAGAFTIESYRRVRTEKNDGFHFVYQPMGAAGEIVARVASFDGAPSNEKVSHAGVLMRSALTPDAANVMMGVRAGPDDGTVFRRWGRYGTSAREESGRAFAAPYWVALLRQGSQFTASRSVDGKTWQEVERARIDMPEKIFVGLVVVSHGGPDAARGVFDHVRVNAVAPAGPFVPRLVLRGGSTLVGPIASVDDTSVTFVDRKQLPSILTRNVAHILFQRLRSSDLIPTGRTGVLLENGDFVDGEFKSLANNRVRISSVLFGLRSYDVNSGVVAVVLREPLPETAAFEIHNRDGSIWLAKSLAVGQDELALDVPALGLRKVAGQEVAEIKRRANGAGRPQ
ncbi:MAG TPA: hypothetical protein VGK40_10195, partial [Verrucomicrobiae bacterium]